MLIICGHQRSGTTMLARIFHQHPEMAVTHEFGALLPVNRPFGPYARALWQRTLHVDARWGFTRPSQNQTINRWQNRMITGRFLVNLLTVAPRWVDVSAVHRGLHRTFPRAAVVGDKLPQYLSLLPELAGRPDIKCVVIYRDCRDVTNSYLKKVHTDWRGQPWAEKFNSPTKVARRWVEKIDLMERYTGRVYIIRYEEFVQNPNHIFNELGNWLGIRPDGFPTQQVQCGRVGNYKTGLSPDEQEAVLAVAGPTMERLGYL